MIVMQSIHLPLPMPPAKNKGYIIAGLRTYPFVIIAAYVDLIC